MREVFASGMAAVVLTGCLGTSGSDGAPPRLADAPYVADIRARLTPPRGECLERALEQVSSRSELLASPLPVPMRARAEALLDGLHPRAKSVLARTHGIWFAQNVPDAAALFLPCDVDPEAGTGGFLLVDAGQFPLDSDVRDVEVPTLYWRALAGQAAPAQSMRAPTYSVRSLDADAPMPPDHAVRYLVYHELGHAYSLLSGEFGLDPSGRMQVTQTTGFVGLSWRLMTTHRKYLPLTGRSPTVQAVVPRRGLDTYEWGSVLATLDANAALFAPGYALHPPRSRAARSRVVCSVVGQLPQAGFVTPTAARYPTEDYAEMFAHALLADEGKIHPNDKVRVDLPGCKVKELLSPYFSPDVLPKRQYIERSLRLDHAPLIPSRPTR